ncbi:MAG: hypothetical protein PVI40_04285 [Chlamydiota bacterium]|jgi:Leucine-rich repeat (LRR) protein
MTISFIEKLENAKKISFFDRRNLSNLLLDFLAKCKNLEFLEISNVHSFDEKKAVSSFHAIKNLKFLYLKDCEAITDEIVSAIPQGCLTIDLSIFDANKSDRLTNEGLAKLLNSCSKLKEVHLYGRKHLSDAVFLQFTSSIQSVVFPGKNGSQLTQKSLLYLSEKCPYLQSLKMGSSPFKIDAFPALKALHVLDLSFCKISPKLFIPKMEKLTSFYLKAVGVISDELVTSLVKSCPNLKNLFLSFNDISDQQVEFLTKNLPFLSVLDLSRSQKITDKSLEIISQSKQLKKVNILGSPLSTSCIKALVKKRPDLEILA